LPVAESKVLERYKTLGASREDFNLPEREKESQIERIRCHPNLPRSTLLINLHLAVHPMVGIYAENAPNQGPIHFVIIEENLQSIPIATVSLSAQAHIIFKRETGNISGWHIERR